MTRRGADRETPRLRGVTELPEVLGERRYRAWIGRGRGRRINLGQYPTRWLAAFAYNVAAESLQGGRRAGNEIPESQQPGADEVRRVSDRVRSRLGLEKPARPVPGRPPAFEQLRTHFEIVAVGFWRHQVEAQETDARGGLDVAASRLVEAARLLFWSQSSGDPTPLEVMEPLLALRLDRAFRRADLTRAVLDDDGDDEPRIARWLVLPDALTGGVGFREAISRLYGDLLGDDSLSGNLTSLPGWARILGVTPPFSVDQIRAAYRARSKATHPDAGGSPEEFIRLQSAYDEATEFLMNRQQV